MRALDRRQWALVVTFVVVLTVTCLFLVRAVRPAIYWHRHQDEPIRAWMTVGYVAHSYHIPRHVLYQELGLPVQPQDRRPLTRIAQELHRPLGDVIAALQAAIARSRATTPLPEPAPP